MLNFVAKSKNLVASVIVCLFIVLVLWIKFGLIYPFIFGAESKQPVDRIKCNCTCWDTWFKGQYEKWPGIYHHVYFNKTWQAGVLWAITVLYILGLYECLRYVVLKIWSGSFRRFYLPLFFFGLYSHHYTWWVYFGYFNDGYYEQVYHQALFSITEFYATWIVLVLATSSPVPNDTLAGPPDNNADGLREAANLATLGAISFAHLAVGSLDQFFDHNILGNGKFYQQIRNWGLVIPDFLGCVCAIWGLIILNRSSFRRLTSNGHHFSLFRNVAKSQHFHQAIFVFLTIFVCGTFLADKLQSLHERIFGVSLSSLTASTSPK